ncbi:MAG: SIS domain-containing protein [Clostridia bacterium]|nr:SIS domain-containing protein [Clostridia bacterium]
MSDKAKYISDYIDLEMRTLQAFDQPAAARVLDAILRAYEAEGTIYVCGNGGSASTASHMANDFNKGISEYVEKKFRFYSLTDNVATMLSIANDISYDEMFRFQLQGRLRKDDLVIGISGSGNSMNVVNALSYAREQGVETVAVCGYSGGKIKEIADIAFHVDINNMQIVEDVHLILNHLLMNVLQRLWDIPGHNM